MNQPDPSTLERLIALVEEAEQFLARGIPSHDVRQACAVARGYLELAREYDEPVNVDDVERVIARMRAAFTLKKPSRQPTNDEGLMGCDLA